MQAVDFLRTWGFAVLGAGLVLVAFLVNRFVPAKRRRIRRALVLYVLYLVFAGVGGIAARIPSAQSWAEHVRLLAELLAAFTLVDLFTLALFDLALPAIGLRLVAITSEIAVALAYVFAGLGVLKAAGVTTASVATMSAAVSAILALSMQATLGNIIGGVALQVDGSIHIGDWIQLPDGTQGKVIAIRWRHTVVETRNWDTIIVPNASLLAQNIVILGKRDGRSVRQHRMWVYFNVDFRFAPSHVIEIVQGALCNAPIEGVADDPKPNVICFDFARDHRDSFAYYAARYWLTDLAADDPTSSRIRARIHSALKRAGIPLARPAQTLFMQAEEEEAARAERHKEEQLHAIEHVDLFHLLTRDERQFVAAHLRYAPFTAGETVTKQGAVAHWLYILTSGTVEVRRRTEDAEVARVVAVVQAPSFFGEMGLMTGEPRSADVVATSDVECYRLDKEAFQRIVHDRPEVAGQMSQMMAKRQVELEAAQEGLDEEARLARMRHAEVDILDRVEEFFGLKRLTRV